MFTNSLLRRSAGLLGFFALLCWSVGARAQAIFPLLGGQRIGTASATFLKIEVGAHAVAMSGAGTALASEATVLYWNPAGAAQLAHNSLSLSHLTWPADIQYDFLGYVHHLPRVGTLGISMGMLHMADMEVTDEYYPTGNGEYFRFQDSFAAFTYARRMTNRFSFGVSVKYVDEVLADVRMGGWMIDLGTFYWTGYRQVRFAVSLVNFGPDLQARGSFLKKDAQGELVEQPYEAFAPPTTFRVGVAGDLYQSDLYSVTAALQVNHPMDNVENAVVGLEVALLQRLHLRGGYRINFDEERLTLGAGLVLPAGGAHVVLDYAFKDFAHLGATHQFTLNFAF
ncbi:MAG: PorV/PorQ family protein [candidate division KSB1 bacterium]|nr:PorV/PorQ family protein [candidate division KSB1 bacterium]